MTTRNFRVNNGISVGDMVLSASANTITGGTTSAPAADGQLANKKYVDDSLIVNNLKQRIESLYPRIKQQQIKAIDLAIQLNNRKINIAKERLDEIMNDFKLQPELLNQYEELNRELSLSLNNLNSLIGAKEKYQLQLLQKQVV